MLYLSSVMALALWQSPTPLRPNPVVTQRLSAGAAMALQDAAGSSVERPSRVAAPMLEPHLGRRSAVSLACLSPGLLMPNAASAVDSEEFVKLKYFPNSLTSAAVDNAVYKSLSARGYNAVFKLRPTPCRLNACCPAATLPCTSRRRWLNRTVAHIPRAHI